MKLSEFHLNSNLKNISEWAYQRKMYFNPDISTQVQEVIFSRKAVKASHPAVFFNDIPVAPCSTHKHLGMYLDEKLNFGHHKLTDDIINYKTFLGSTSKAMGDRGKKMGRQKYKNLNISRTKRAF